MFDRSRLDHVRGRRSRERGGGPLFGDALCSGRRRRTVLERLEDRCLLAVQPFPLPLCPVEPLGSLVYERSVEGSVDVVDEPQDYMIELEGSQVAAAVVACQLGEELRPVVQILDPDGAALATATAAAAGEGIALPTVAVANAGSHTVRVSGAGGTTGKFMLSLSLGAGLEDEAYGLGANDDPASAQDLDAGFRGIETSSVQRAAVRGSLAPSESTVICHEDFESGVLGERWTTYSSGPAGEVLVTDEFGAADGSMCLHLGLHFLRKQR